MKNRAQCQYPAKGVLYLCNNMMHGCIAVLSLILAAIFCSLPAIAANVETYRQPATEADASSGLPVWIYVALAVTITATIATIAIAVYRINSCKVKTTDIIKDSMRQETEKSHILATLRAAGIRAWRYDVATRRFYNVWGMKELNGTGMPEMRKLIIPEDFPAFLNYLNLIETGEQSDASVRVRCNAPETTRQELIAEFEMVPVTSNGNITDIVASVKNVVEENHVIQDSPRQESNDDANLPTGDIPAAEQPSATNCSKAEEPAQWQSADTAACLHDLNERLQQATDNAAEISQLLQHIIDNSPLSVFVKDASNEHRYLHVNALFCELMHYSASEIIGHNDFELLPAERAKMFYDSDCEALHSPIPVVSTESPTSVDEEGRFWRTQKTSITLPDGRKIIIGISSDVSELKQANIALVKAKERAEKSDRLKSAFLANMSHEIRTPLNAIVGFSQLLQETTDKEEMAEYIKIINENNELLLRLINDILYLSKIDAGVAELFISSTDVADMLDDISIIAAHNNANPNVKIICDRRYRPCICNIDRERIMQVWLNFVTNALKYTQEGYIKIGFDCRDGGLYFYVQDTGIGIADDKQDRVFGRFEKLDSFAQGNGLGLSICKAIIDLCKGKIGFNSKKFKGSTFYAWIPTETKAELISDRSEADCLPAEKKKTPNDEKQEHRLNILVCEDNENNYLLIKKILNFCNIYHAANGLECVGMVKQNRFDAVLMDIIMPVMDGLEATREIRKFDTTTPIIAVTANTFDTDSAKAIDAGCNGYLPKPINRTLLLNALSKVIPLP